MRKVFFSFHYENDNWRVQTIKQMGVIDFQIPVSSNKWEEIRLKNDRDIKYWIDENIKGCSCLVVLIGSETANRKYVQYEIEKAWNEGKGVLGIYIHNLKNCNRNTSSKGNNPFNIFKFDLLNENSKNILIRPILNIPTHSYDTNYLGNNLFSSPSRNWYNQIKLNLPYWVEKAIDYRKSWAYKIKKK
ncbi:TIR domain-containing protein [Moraxella sp. Pampa]|uniref:TIR domain-containing protein n=1 Tax=Moraxella sp. Pampa TaxID=3111978 RepID=UPI002B4096A8|nr:TIR domain-containing protein [Moraxella sp. Pampa]